MNFPFKIVLTKELPSCPEGTIFKLDATGQFYYNETSGINLTYLRRKEIESRYNVPEYAFEFISHWQTNLKQYIFTTKEVVSDFYFSFRNGTRYIDDIRLIALTLTEVEKRKQPSNDNPHIYTIFVDDKNIAYYDSIFPDLSERIIWGDL